MPGRSLLIIIVLIIICTSASGRFYQVTERDTGWTTGLRQSINTTLDLSGSAVGDGKYYRYTDMNFDDVRMRERIAAANGTLDTSELIYLKSETTNPIEISLEKSPGTQNYTLTVNETWPVVLAARRSIDYIGQGISDRDFMGNNLDYVGASFIRTKDLKKTRGAFMELKGAWFEVLLNNTTKTLYYDRFLPAKTIDYRLDSSFQGQAVLKYKQAEDRNIAKENVEIYTGSFTIRRGITMGPSGRKNITDGWVNWLPICLCEENESLPDVVTDDSYEELS